MQERLQKYLARCGVASRRKAEEYILAGRVSLNGRVVKQLGTVVLENDKVTFDGKPVKPQEQFVYYALNKPKGVITTSSDEKGRQTVLDFIPKAFRVVACGRLDAASRGLVILTNDGSLCYELTHPSREHEKEYSVTATINQGPELSQRLTRLEQGVMLDDGVTQPVKVSDVHRQGSQIRFRVTLHEGRNRQVRRMCSAVGLDVVDLVRTRMAKLKLTDIPEGHWRQVRREDIF